MPMCQNGNTDMFEPQEWDLLKFTDECEKKWKVTPKPYLIEKLYGGKDLSTASNIIFRYMIMMMMMIIVKPLYLG